MKENQMMKKWSLKEKIILICIICVYLFEIILPSISQLYAANSTNVTRIFNQAEFSRTIGEKTSPITSVADPTYIYNDQNNSAKRILTKTNNVVLGKNGVPFKAVDKYETNSKADNKYMYSFKVTSKTEISFWNESSADDNDIIFTSDSKTIRLMPTSNDQSGKIGCYVKNAGTYITGDEENGYEIHTIGLKLTYFWQEASVKLSNGNYFDQFPYIGLAAKYEQGRLWFHFDNQSYRTKIEIFDGNPTNGNPIDVDMSAYINDMDGAQFVGLGAFNSGSLKDHIKEIQVVNRSNVYTDDTPNSGYANYVWFYSKEGARDDILEDSVRLELDNVRSFNFVVGSYKDYTSYIYGDRLYKSSATYWTREAVQKMIDNNSFPAAGIYISSNSYQAYNIKEPVETIQDISKNVENYNFNVKQAEMGYNEEFYYKVYHVVTDEMEPFYYTSYKLETTLPKEVTFTNGNAKVYKVLGDETEGSGLQDVSSNFTINTSTTDGQTKITATAKSNYLENSNFYNNVYLLRIRVKLNSNLEDISEPTYPENDKRLFTVNNKSYVNIERRKGSTVLADGVYKIETDAYDTPLYMTMYKGPQSVDGTVAYMSNLSTSTVDNTEYNGFQDFEIEYFEDEYFSIIGKINGKALAYDATAGIVQRNKNLSDQAQQWRLSPSASSYTIRPRSIGLDSTLTVTQNADETYKLGYATNKYTANQCFKLVPVTIKNTDNSGDIYTNEVEVDYYEKKIDVTKQWNDDANNLETRPESINFSVSNGNTVVDSGTITVDETNSQTVKTKYLPILNNLEQVIDYQVSENDITGYTPNYTTTKDEDGVSLLKIDNNLNEYEYRVEYYYDEIIDNSKTVRGTAKYNDVISSYTAKNKTGYVFDRDEGKPLKISTDESKNVIKVYYKKRTDLKGTVNYYLDGTTQKLRDSKTLTKLKFADVLNASDYIEEIDGYTYTRANPASITVKTSASSNVLNLYYTPNNYNYTVEYYYNNVKDNSKTDTFTAEFNSVIENVEDKIIEGYKHDRTETLPFTITSNPNNNIIRVYYVTDDGNTKNLQYTVEYYKDGKKQSADTQVIRKTVQVLEPNTLPVEEIENKENKYEGYRFDHSNPATIPSIVETGTIIKLYYVKRTDLTGTVNHYLEGTTIKVADSENLENLEFGKALNASDYIKDITGYTYTGADPATITVGVDSEENVLNLYYAINRYNYTVEYYYNGVQDTEAKETHSADYNTNITTYTDKNKTGYKLEKAEPIPLVIKTNEDENVLRVYYVTDPTNKKILKYTVEYYKDGTKVSADTQTETLEVQYLEPNTLRVKTDEINIEDKYEGYRFDHSNPASIPEIANDGDVFKIYYVKRTDLTGTVNYYLEGTTTPIASPKSLKNLKFQATVKASSHKKSIDGYTYTRANPTSIKVGVDSTKNVLNLYYTKNTYDYTVEYYYNNVKDNDATVHGEAEFESKITTYTDKNKQGYMFSKTENLPLTITSNSDNNIIKVYYVTDDEQTKLLSYTVEYYKDNVLQTKDTETESITVQYLEPNTIRVEEEKINKNKYEGYVFSHTDPASIPATVNNGDVIKVYYVKRQDLTGTVNHYLQGTTTQVAPSETLENLQFEQVVKASDHIANVIGYTYVGASPTSITVGTNPADNVLNLYYTINKYNYTVEYYYDGVQDTSLKETHSANYNAEITEYTDNNKPGYKFEKVEPVKLVIGTNEAQNVIRVYYVTDPTNKKILTYTVEYYKDGVKQTSDTQTESIEVQYLQPNTIPVKEGIINKNKYEGYVFSHTNPASIPATVNNGDVIKVYYVKRQDLTGTVNHYLQGTTKIVAPSETLENLEFEQVVKAVDHKANVEGHTYTGAEPASITVGVDSTQNVLNLYYSVNRYNYTIEYYYSNVKDTTKTVHLAADYNSKITTYPDKKITGYKFDKVENLPLTIGTNENENLIKVYYVPDDGQTKTISYTVEYYKDGIKQTSDTQTESKTIQLLEPETLKVEKEKINTENKYVGYVFSHTDPASIPEVANNGDVIKVYYVKRTDLTGKVNYYLQGTTTKIKESKDLTGLTFEQIVKAVDHKENITGYTYTGANPASITVGIDSTQNVLNLYYTINSYAYTVEYYYNNVKDDSKTINGSANYNSVIETVPDRNIVGYKYLKTENLPLTIGTNPNNNIIKVYYITDDENTKDLQYTVEYYKNGVKQTSDTQIETKTVQILEPDTLKVETEKINTENKYEGYVFDHTDPASIPNIVNTGTIIKVYYVKRQDLTGTVNYYLEGTTTKVADSKALENLEYEEVVKATDHKKSIKGYTYVSANPETITVGLDNTQNVLNLYYKINKYNYTIEYYYDGVKDTTETVTKPVDYNTVISTYPDRNRSGYKFEKHENVPLTVGIDETQNVIKVYYIIDNEQTKLLHYTVEYYKDGVKQNSDTQTVEERVQLLADDVLRVKKEEINMSDKYEGYVFKHTDPLEIPGTINNNGVIKVYYEKRTDLLGIVNYYLEGTNKKLKASKELTGLTYKDVVKAIDHKEDITGYHYVSANPETITVGVDSTQNVLNLYYAPNDYKYTIEYYYNGEIDDSLTEKPTAKYNQKITNYPEKPKNGYKFSKTENLPLTIGTDETQNIIKVYYVIDNGQTKTLTYTVEYYKDGEKIEEDTQIESVEVQVLQPDTLKVETEKINTSDKYEGYVFKNTDPESIPDKVNNGTVIKVYYEKMKNLSGIVNYYLKGTTTKIADSKLLENLTYNDVINATTHKKDITGYSYDSANPASLTVSVNPEENVINIYYTINKYKYKVEYYYNNVKDEKATDEIYANYNTQITEYTQKPKEGYEFSRDENLPLTIGIDETQNIIKVHYTKKTDLKGIVNYYIKGTKTKLIESKDLNNLTFQDEITAESQKVKIVGYDYDGGIPESIIVGENEEDNVLNLYYTEIKGVLEITKVDSKTNQQLQGAIYQLVKLTDVGEIDTSFTLQEKTTNEQGKAVFNNLTYGKYMLKETKAVDGYNLLSEPIEVVVNESTLGENRKIKMTIRDNKKNVLPATGGNGAKIIIINGLVILYIAYLIKKKRIYIVKK